MVSKTFTSRQMRIIFWPLLLAALAAATSYLYLPYLSFNNNNPMSTIPPLPTQQARLIPVPNDWVDYGPVLEAGAEGEWDFMFAGITPASVVKKDGTYFFYYVAADGYRSFDGGPRHRSIGVATSQDGIHFTKYDNNPIMTHRPFNGEEEGANSAGITLDKEGRFVMVYGAAMGPRELINADARYAYSDDGFSFTDAGLALHFRDRNLYGFGDEIFPVAVL
jgi:hypothetical protein